MSDKPGDKETFLGLSRPEWDNLKSGMQYIGSIVLLVVITFLILATMTRMLGI